MYALMQDKPLLVFTCVTAITRIIPYLGAYDTNIVDIALLI